MAFLDEVGLAELWELIKAEDEKLLAADVKIATGSYTGTGTSGANNKTSVTFPFVPKIVILHRAGYLTPYNGYWATGFIWTTGMVQISTATSGNSGYNNISLSGKTLSWYNTSIEPEYQLNESGAKYYYTAIG